MSPRPNQLAYLSDAGWVRLCAMFRASDRDAVEHSCIELWAANRFPLVTTRQPVSGEHMIALGLPAPARFDRRRIAISAPSSDVASLDPFPTMSAIGAQFDEAFAVCWALLAERLMTAGCAARVYGSRGWQVLTGLDYVHAGSDIDLTLPVGSAASADEVCGLLADHRPPGPRIDGELVFPDGAAVAWREWRQWRAGRVRAMMVKQGRHVALVSDVDWLAPADAS